MQAWITLLSRDDDYLLGVRVMARSLRDVGSAYPMVVLVTDAVGADARAQLVADGCTVTQVDPIAPVADGGYVFDHFTEVWTKLAVWGMTDYERLVLVDADMLVLENMDELFSMPLPDGGVAACQTCRCNPERNPAYPADWAPDNCFYSYAGARLPAGFRPYFNSGLVVLEPDAEVFAALQAEVAGITDLAAYPFPEQDLLNEVFAGRWSQLPYRYNALKTLTRQHPDVWHLPDVRNIHYLLGKPWAAQPDPAYAELNALWQRTHDAVVADDGDRPPHAPPAS